MFRNLTTKDIVFVGAQLLLFVLFIGLPALYRFNFSDHIRIVGAILAVVGVLVCLASIYQLRSSLTPFPSPTPTSRLIQTGLYKYVRHPIYSGILMTMIGYGVFTGSFSRLLVALATLVLFYFKSGFEETLLLKRYPEYHLYRKNSWRFFPLLV